MRADGGRVVAAVNVSVHATRATVEDIERRFVPELLETVTRISADLGALGPAMAARRDVGRRSAMTDIPDQTQVGIIGAGPAGLVLSHLLKARGIDSVVLEVRDREYVEQRVRAGVLEDPTVRLLRELHLADRLDREGLAHRGIALAFEGRRHRIDFVELTGTSITVYGQQEVVKDLIAARLAAGDPIVFEALDAEPTDVETDKPVIRYRHDGASASCSARSSPGATASTAPAARGSPTCTSPSGSTPSPGSASWPRPRRRSTS